MTNDSRRDLAWQLAVLLDQRFAPAWSTKPQLAVMRHGDGGGEVEVFELDEPATSTLTGLPRLQQGAVAVGITALGHATPTEYLVPCRVRVSVAATCCDVVAIVRSVNVVQESRSVDGEIVTDIRAWARLDSCSCRAA